MKETKKVIPNNDLKLFAKEIIQGKNNEIYLSVNENDFAKNIEFLSQKTFKLIGLFCAENFEFHNGFTLFYTFEKCDRKDNQIIILQRSLESNKANSVAAIFPSACWFEREVSDGFGIDFIDAYDKRRLFLHEIYPEGFHPLRKNIKNEPLKQKAYFPKNEYQFKEVTGEGVFQIPVGPVHAGIIEPGHFRFSVIGETIFNLEIRMFFKHRGIEKLAEGKKPDDCIKIAETVSGDESVSNSVAFCTAVEKISGIEVPKRAEYVRAILLEMERIYSHLSDMAGMIIDIAYPVGASDYFNLREEIFRKNQKMTGSRFSKGIMQIGGLSKDVSNKILKDLSEYLLTFKKRFKKNTESVLSLSSVYDRLETTGVVKKDLVLPLALSGPTARCTGVSCDERIYHPYGIYSKIVLHEHLSEKGDVLSRFDIKFVEISDSIEIIRKLISEIPPGSINSASNNESIKDGYTLSLIEAPRGQNLHFVYIKDGVVDRYKVRTSSFCNWQAIEHAVLGNIVPDFPLVNKSLNLTYAGTDL